MSPDVLRRLLADSPTISTAATPSSFDKRITSASSSAIWQKPDGSWIASAKMVTYLRHQLPAIVT